MGKYLFAEGKVILGGRDWTKFMGAASIAVFFVASMAAAGLILLLFAYGGSLLKAVDFIAVNTGKALLVYAPYPAAAALCALAWFVYPRKVKPEGDSR